MPWDASKDELDYPFAKTFESAMESAGRELYGWLRRPPMTACRYCNRSNSRGTARCAGCGRTLWEQHANNFLKRRTAEGALQEGTRVQIRKLIPRLRAPSLRGHLAVSVETFEGTVRVILADDHEWTTNVRLVVERENGALEEVPLSCLAAVIEEHHPSMEEMLARTQYTHQRVHSERGTMKTEAYLTKGMRVRVQRLKAQPMGTYSLAGAQMKVAATEDVFEGIVRHIWADDAAGTKNVRLQLEREDGALEEVPIGCVVCVLEEGSV